MFAVSLQINNFSVYPPPPNNIIIIKATLPVNSSKKFEII